MEQKFNELSLEYKMTHIGRAKKYARYLHEINCFYSDKQPDFEVVNEITDDDKNTDNALDRIGELEHDRWCFDHYAMGWIAGKKIMILLTTRQLQEKGCASTRI